MTNPGQRLADAMQLLAEVYAIGVDKHDWHQRARKMIAAWDASQRVEARQAVTEAVVKAACNAYDHANQMPGAADVEPADYPSMHAAIKAAFAAAPPAPELQCTCPSGDGSLKWQCPVHPPR